MGCGGSKPETPEERRERALREAMAKAANSSFAKATAAANKGDPLAMHGSGKDLLRMAAGGSRPSLLKVQSSKSVIDIISELQRWKGTTRYDGVDFGERFETVKELGAGAFGTVYRVKRKEDGAAFAAKTVLRARCKNARQWKTAHREVESWTALSSPYHPAILQLIEVVHVEESSIHLVTEVMSGGELSDAINRVEMSEQNCRLITVQLAAALAHLHLCHSVAHRDVKPANVLCRSARNPMKVGGIKLADFGLCYKFEEKSTPQKWPELYVGSIDYFAPELATIMIADKRKESCDVQVRSSSSKQRHTAHTRRYS